MNKKQKTLIILNSIIAERSFDDYDKGFKPEGLQKNL